MNKPNIKKITYGFLCYVILTCSYAQGNEPIQQDSPSLSICTNTAQIFHMNSGQPVQLSDVKNFLHQISDFTDFSPRSAVENIMNLSKVENMVFYCSDISVIQNFTAQIFFTYVEDEKKIQTPEIVLNLVPPDRPKPQPLQIPVKKSEIKEIIPKEPEPESQPADQQPDITNQLQ